MRTARRLIAIACLITPASTATAQVRSSGREAVALSRTTWTAVLPQPATIAPVAPGTINVPAADLRPAIAHLGLTPRHQQNRPTCSVHALTFLLEYMAATRRGHNYGDLSEEYLNLVGNRAAGKTDDGDFFSVLEQGYRTYGIASETAFPYHATYDASLVPSAMVVQHAKLALASDRLVARFIKPWDRTKGPNEAQLAEVLEQLKANVPVAVGLWWPKLGTFQTTPVAGVDIVSDLGKDPSGSLQDGHSVVLVGYALQSQLPGGGYFIFRNSGGPDWGDHGYGYLSFEYVRKYANDLLVYLPAVQLSPERVRRTR